MPTRLCAGNVLSLGYEAEGLLRRRVCSAWMDNSNTLLDGSSKTLLGWKRLRPREYDQASKGED